MNLKLITTCFCVFYVKTSFAQSDSRWTLHSEFGRVSIAQNSVQIPNPSGTKFSFSDLTGSGPFNFSRLELFYAQAPDTEWRLLYAPLSVSGSGILTQTTNFAGSNFNPGVADAFYQFYSYRVTYRKKWKKTEKSDWKFGFTAKIRDAEVSVRQGAVSASQTDLGFVPLLHLYGTEKISDRLSFSFDFDGLAGGPGRAFDVGARLNCALGSSLNGFIGLRALEGGADVPKVNNFVLFTYLTFGIERRF
jgi:hypothetical protein